MQKLKIILLSRKFLIGIIVGTIFYLFLILHFHIVFTNYKEGNTCIIGIVTSIKEKTNYNQIILFAKEPVLIMTNNHYSLGNKIQVCGVLEYPNTNTNFHLFSYRNYLLSKHIVFQMKEENSRLIKVHTFFFFDLKSQFLSYLSNFKGEPYLKTFLLGDQSLISNTQLKIYQHLGISHLFSLSGMHVSFLAIFLGLFLSKKKIAVFLLGYAIFTGGSPSILRATICFFFYTHKKQFPSVLFFVYLFIFFLVANPYYLYHMGFLYSFYISFSCLIFSKYIRKESNYFKKLLLISLISFIAGIPITLWFQYELYPIGIVINLLFVPFVTFLFFPLSFLTAMFPFLDPIYFICIQLFEEITKLIHSFSIPIVVGFPGNFIYLYILFCLLAISGIVKKKRKRILPLLFLLIIQICNPYFSSDATVTVLDVGQGDSILMELPKRKGIFLIDTGGKYSKNNTNQVSSDIIIPYLKSRGIDVISILIISHGDYDHMGEAINLVNNFKVEKVIFNCGPYNDLEKELIKVLDKKKIPYYSCIKELNINDSKLYFLQTKEYDNENDNSNVIYTELDGYKFMFMGDASTTTEHEILDRYNLSNIDVLKVGHHGSKTSSSKEFINEINPKYSVISVGKNNRYGHPNKEVLDNLNDSKVYRTDQDGSIMFKIKNNKLKIETCSP